jgi:hypothetical protein
MMYYKPDMEYRRENWPHELLTTRSADLSQYTPRTLREVTSFFLYEKWHPNLPDPLCWYLKYPRFAVKLNVPQLSLKDLMFMAADVTVSLMSLAGAEIGGMPAGVASLVDVVDEFLSVEFSIYLELSLVHGSVPEWEGEFITRGLFLNATASAYVFGFEFDFQCVARLQLPTPTKWEALLMAADVARFILNPMGLITGEITLDNVPVKAGIDIFAKTTLPFDFGEVGFEGTISKTLFRLAGWATVELLPSLSVDASFEFVATQVSGITLQFGGDLELGPFGSFSAHGAIGTTPTPYFAVTAAFCRPLFAPSLTFSGTISVCAGDPPPDAPRCEQPNSASIEARTDLGFLGEATLNGLVSWSPRFHLQASAELSFDFDSLVDGLINTIVRIITGTSDPESNILAKALKLVLSSVTSGLSLIEGARMAFETGGTLDLTLILNVADFTRELTLPVPLPVRRKLARVPSAGEMLPGWPHPEDPRLNATRRRALLGGCAFNSVAAITAGDVLDQMASFFSSASQMVSALAPINKDIDLDLSVDFLPVSLAAELRLELLTAGTITMS